MCPDCQELFNYARERVGRCPVHCYQGSYRESNYDLEHLLFKYEGVEINQQDGLTADLEAVQPRLSEPSRTITTQNWSTPRYFVPPFGPFRQVSLGYLTESICVLKPTPVRILTIRLRLSMIAVRND